MSDPEEPIHSFDPRTWVQAGAERTDAPHENGHSARLGDKDEELTSFDPKSWSIGVIPEETVPAAEAERTRLSPRATPRSAYFVAGGAAAFLLLLGGGFAHWSRSSGPPEQTGIGAGGKAPADRAVSAIPSGSQRTIVLAAASEIVPSLLTAGIDPAQARQAGGEAAAVLGAGTGDIRLQFEFVEAEGKKQLIRLEASRDNGSGILVAADGSGAFSSRKIDAKLATTIKAIRGEMDGSSFYSSAVSAGVTDSLISDFAKAFSFDFDFQREIHQGDVFEAAFEQDVNPHGQPVGAPRLVYASMTTAEKSRRFYRFRAPGQAEAGWFDDNGASTVRSLMRTPVDGARVSSNFGYRTHPILGYQKLHRGTDFAAPSGTPIYASGNAVVEFAMMRGAAGNMVRLRHDNGWFTHYFHLSAFAPGMAPGTRVSQGQQIGDVGTTGRSTGPHLHYELFIDGQPVDPMSIDTGTGMTLSGEALAAFRKERDRIDLSRSARSE